MAGAISNPCSAPLYSTIINDFASLLPAAQSYCSAHFPLVASTTTSTSIGSEVYLTSTSLSTTTPTSTATITVTLTATATGSAETTTVETDTFFPTITQTVNATTSVAVAPVTVTVCSTVAQPARLKRGPRILNAKSPSSSCVKDSCWLALDGYLGASVSKFCSAYLKSTAPALPNDVAIYGPARISSACECLTTTSSSPSSFASTTVKDSCPVETTSSTKAKTSSPTTTSSLTKTTTPSPTTTISSTKMTTPFPTTTISSTKSTTPSPTTTISSTKSTTPSPTTTISSTKSTTLPPSKSSIISALNGELCSCIEKIPTSTVVSTSTPITTVTITQIIGASPVTSIATAYQTATVTSTPIVPVDESTSITGTTTYTATTVTISVSAAIITQTLSAGANYEDTEPASGGCGCKFTIYCGYSIADMTVERNLIAPDYRTCELACDSQENCFYAVFDSTTYTCSISTVDFGFLDPDAGFVAIIKENGSCAYESSSTCTTQ